MFGFFKKNPNKHQKIKYYGLSWNESYEEYKRKNKRFGLVPRVKSVHEDSLVSLSVKKSFKDKYVRDGVYLSQVVFSRIKDSNPAIPLYVQYQDVVDDSLFLKIWFTSGHSLSEVTMRVKSMPGVSYVHLKYSALDEGIYMVTFLNEKHQKHSIAGPARLGYDSLFPNEDPVELYFLNDEQVDYEEWLNSVEVIDYQRGLRSSVLGSDIRI